MKKIQATAAVVGVGAATLLAPVVAQAPAEASSCPSTMTFAVGGVGDGNSKRVPGVGNGPVTRIHYSGSIAPVGGVGGDTSVSEGERALDRSARAFRDRCPSSHVRVVGNSMGALVAGNVRDKWNNSPKMKKNSNFVLVADGRAKNGAMSQLPSFIPGFTHTGPRPQSSIPTSSLCRPNDAICNIGNPLKDPGHAIDASIGYLTVAHGYSNVEVTDKPGQHDLPAKGSVVPDTPLPWSPPNPRQILEPIAQAVVPTAPIIVDHYEPTPIKEYVPPIIKKFIPKEIGNIVLPKINLPKLPTVRIPR